LVRQVRTLDPKSRSCSKMLTRSRLWPVALLLLAPVGCQPAAPTSPEPEKTQPPGAAPAPTPAEGEAAAPAEGEAAAKIDTSAITLSEEQLAEIEKLPEADRALALEQKVCPSSEEPLGSMGVPIKMEAKGVTVFVCCAGCKGDMETKPDEMLAKLGKTPAEAAPAEGQP
jgi:hypothetical protein